MKKPSDIKAVEELLGITSARVQITIVYDPSKRKLRGLSNGVWVRFPNNLRVEGAVYEAEVKRGKADHYIALVPITPINDIAKKAAR